MTEWADRKQVLYELVFENPGCKASQLGALLAQEVDERPLQLQKLLDEMLEHGNVRYQGTGLNRQWYPVEPPEGPDTRVACLLWEGDQEGYGKIVQGVTAECTRCGHETRALGIANRSVRACLVAMAEECPRDESNYYYDEDDDRLAPTEHRN